MSKPEVVVRREETPSSETAIGRARGTDTPLTDRGRLADVDCVACRFFVKATAAERILAQHMIEYTKLSTLERGTRPNEISVTGHASWADCKRLSRIDCVTEFHFKHQKTGPSWISLLSQN